MELFKFIEEVDWIIGGVTVIDEMFVDDGVGTKINSLTLENDIYFMINVSMSSWRTPR